MIPSIGMNSGYIANVLNGMHSILHLPGTGNVTGIHCVL